MSDLISKQVLELWNRYKPTIAVDAIEYDRELKKLLGTNLASLGTDCISRQQAIDAINEYMVGKRCDTDGTMMARLINELVIKQLSPIQPKSGRWILDRSGTYCCSECMEPCAGYVMMKPRDKFCKMCGAKMEVTT